MRQVVMLTTVSLVSTLVAALLLIPTLMRLGIVDVPNHRSSHEQITPRAGGLACIVGVGVAFASARLPDGQSSWLLLLMLCFLGMAGLLDDVRSLSPKMRLAAQALVGGAIGSVVAGPGWWTVAGIVVVATIVNAVNFMDGINGLTALTCLCWGVSLLLTVGGQSGILTLVGSAVAGASLGFLPMNFPRARLFLGDTGSYFLGALIALGLLLSWRAGLDVLRVGAPLIIYFVDTGFTLTRRAVLGHKLTEAHSDHVYQRLVRLNSMSHATTSFFILFLSATASVACALSTPSVFVPILLGLSALYLASPTLIKAMSKRSNPVND